jgi:GntR family transcriptional regulator
MLKRSPSLTELVKSRLKQRILKDEFEAGRIPSETDLATELRVSRTTIRDALSRLELEGFIFRKQGAGTFINKASLQIKTRLEEIWAYEAMLEAHGYTPSTEILEIEEKTVEAQIATDLGLSLNETVLVVKKLFLADSQPVILTFNYIPTRLIKVNHPPDVFHQPVFQFLDLYCQQQLSYYLSEIVPLITPDWLATLLHLPQSQTALLSFEEIGYNQENLPILRACSYFRDDLLRLRLIRREG